MGKYKIKIHYQTGDSFHNEDAIDILEIDWESPEIAKENLKRISEHYKFYKSLNSFSPKKPREELIEENKTKEWFVPGDYEFEYCLKLKLDNGNEVQISPFWCGYFERLNMVEIIQDDGDMKIIF